MGTDRLWTHVSTSRQCLIDCGGLLPPHEFDWQIAGQVGTCMPILSAHGLSPKWQCLLPET
eukprot:8237449-Prorocentrum_lima.AAC.1